MKGKAITILIAIIAIVAIIGLAYLLRPQRFDTSFDSISIGYSGYAAPGIDNTQTLQQQTYNIDESDPRLNTIKEILTRYPYHASIATLIHPGVMTWDSVTETLLFSFDGPIGNIYLVNVSPWVSYGPRVYRIGWWGSVASGKLFNEIKNVLDNNGGSAQ